MSAWEDISDGRRLKEPIVVTIITADYQGGESGTECKLRVRDENGKEFDFDIWATHGLDVEWKPGYWYKLDQALGKVWNDGRSRKLSSTEDLKVLDYGPASVNRECNLLVIGDTHIGFKHRDDFDRSWQNDVDCLASFRKAVSVAIEQDVDAVIHAGDIFDDKGEPTGEEITEMADLLLQLYSYHHIPFFYIIGNHEIADGLEMLELGEMAGESRHLTINGHLINDTAVEVYGIDYHKPDDFPKNPSFRTPNTGSFNILVLHQDLSPIRPDGDVDLTRILTSGVNFDFVISGDLHDASRYSLDGTKVLYPGATADISTKNNRTSPSAWLLKISGGEASPPKRIPL